MDLQRGPLLPTVPLSGTQTVQGLRDLERQAQRQLLQRASAPLHSPQQRSRYRGPHSWELPPEALKAPPRPWQDFFGGTPLASRYDLPASLGHLQHRLDENLVQFLANYLRVAGALFCLVLYVQPGALVGMVLLFAIGLVNLHVEQTAARPKSEGLQALQSVSMMLAVLAVFWGRTLLALFRWLLVVAAAVAVHGCARVPPSERAGDGVPILAALYNRDGHPDPRRVFREAWRVARGHGEYGAWLAADWLHSNVAAAGARIRGLLDAGMPTRLINRPPSDDIYLT